MIYLILKKGGLIDIKKWTYDDKTGKGEYLVIPMQIDKIMSYLENEIILEESFTLRDYFKLIDSYPLLQKLDLYFPSYMKEFLSLPKSGCVNDDMSKIVLEYNVASDTYSDELKDELQVYMNVSGMSANEDTLRYGLDFCPLSYILDLPIVLGEALIYRIKDYVNVQEQRNEKFSYSLYNLVHSIIYELSFYGTPEERDKKGKELEEEI